MKVVLLSHTPDPIGTIYAAARGCYSDLASSEIKDRGVEPPTADKFVKGIIKSGHESVLEHAVFTFSIEGISRACSHQLVRHRVASYSQQSQRYVRFDQDVSKCLFVAPPHIGADDDANHLFWKFMDLSLEYYQRISDILLANGRTQEQANEDARFVLPNAAKTNITVTMNARELRHFFNQRECKRAQWEIRDVASAMLIICLGVAESLFYDSGAGCRRGTCPEGKMTCGEPYPSIQY